MVRVTQGAQRSLALSPRCLRGFGAAVGAAGGGTWGQAPGSATRGDSRAGPASAMNTPLQTWARRRGWQHHCGQRCSCAQHRCQKSCPHGLPWGVARRMVRVAQHVVQVPWSTRTHCATCPYPKLGATSRGLLPWGDEGSWDQACCLESRASARADHFASGNSQFFQCQLQLLPPQQSCSGCELPPGTETREMAPDQPPFCSPAQGTVGDWKVVLFNHYIWRYGDPRIEFMHKIGLLSQGI